MNPLKLGFLIPPVGCLSGATSTEVLNISMPCKYTMGEIKFLRSYLECSLFAQGWDFELESIPYQGLSNELVERTKER